MITDPEAVFKAYPNAVHVNQDGAWDSSNNEITIVQSNVDAARVELAKLDYKKKRAKEYPSMSDQLDDIYHNGIDAWKSTIKTIKDKYPK